LFLIIIVILKLLNISKNHNYNLDLFSFSRKLFLSAKTKKIHKKKSLMSSESLLCTETLNDFYNCVKKKTKFRKFVITNPQEKIISDCPLKKNEPSNKLKKKRQFEMILSKLYLNEEEKEIEPNFFWIQKIDQNKHN
jgi:hypothetical protein